MVDRYLQAGDETSTRGRILVLLRRARRTVSELADLLGISDNAVRAHLVALERDGLVQQRGVKRGVGKPAHVYDLTGSAEGLFPKAYGAVLSATVAVLSEVHGPAAAESLLREVGRRIGADRRVAGLEGEARLRAALDVLGDLGGMAELERRNGSVAIQGYRCPLAEVAATNPEACALAEALVAELVGVPVRERCERGAPGEPPRCRFELLARAAAGGS